MGDRSKSAVHSELLAYLDDRGVDLHSEGISERGLHLPDALAFIDLLSRHGVTVLGMEPWRYSSGRYRIESLGVWASDSSDPDPSNAEAKRVVALFNLKADDVVTIQF